MNYMANPDLAHPCLLASLGYDRKGLKPNTLVTGKPSNFQGCEVHGILAF